MITEDYVSSDIAKLLREKGFDWDDSPFSSEQEKDEWIQNNSYSIPNPNYNADIPFDSETLTMVAPHISLQKAMKWLRVVHNIDICAFPCYYNYNSWGYDCQIFKNKDLLLSLTQFSSFEKAVETAVEVALQYYLEK